MNERVYEVEAWTVRDVGERANEVEVAGVVIVIINPEFTYLTLPEGPAV